MKHSSVRVPHAGEIQRVPELAILASLETTLAVTIQVVAASLPEVCDEHADTTEYGAEIELASSVSGLASQLIDAIHRYRSALTDAGTMTF